MNFLVVGLGNIGVEYADTRHNIGFSILDTLAKVSNISFVTKRYGDVAEYRFKGRSFLLLKPSTYMNLSGRAVNYWLQAESIKREDLLVIVDDLALPLGSIRIRKQGSDGGHNGLKNISETLGDNNFNRLRVGIGDNFGRGGQVDFVLGKWSGEEQKELPAIYDKAIEVVQAFGTQGVDRCMNLFNKR